MLRTYPNGLTTKGGSANLSCMHQPSYGACAKCLNTNAYVSAVAWLFGTLAEALPYSPLYIYIYTQTLLGAYQGYDG